MASKYVCDTVFVHEDTVKKVQSQIINKDLTDKVSNFFKAIADPTRMKILYALKHHELCVCDICVILDMTQSAISHQLRTLKDIDLVRTRRDGKTIFYRLADDHVHLIFDQALKHLMEDHNEEFL